MSDHVSRSTRPSFFSRVTLKNIGRPGYEATPSMLLTIAEGQGLGLGLGLGVGLVFRVCMARLGFRVCRGGPNTM